MLVKLFKLIREDSLEFGLQRRAPEDEAWPKIETRSTAQSTGCAQTCTLGEKCCNDRRPGRSPRGSGAAEDSQSTARSIIQNVIFGFAQLAVDRPECRLKPAQRAVDRTTFLSDFLFGFWIHF